MFRTSQQAVKACDKMYLEDHLDFLRNDRTGWKQVKACVEIIPQIWDIVDTVQWPEPHVGVYGYKHRVESVWGDYVSMSAFIVACYLTNIPLKRIDDSVWRVGLIEKETDTMKKTSDAIAKAIRVVRDNPSVKSDVFASEVVPMIAFRASDVFAENNIKFDECRFLRACGVVV